MSSFFSKISGSVFVRLAIVGVPLCFLYANAARTLVYDWSTDPNFSHGFLIVPIALYMVWAVRERLKALPCLPSGRGFFLILAGMLMHIAGQVGAEFFLMRFSMVVTLAGIVWTFWGWPCLKALAVPLAYLVLMIPIPAILWNKIAFPLQLLAAHFSGKVIMLIGIPVFREGNILHLANTSLEVVDACSGLRSLTSLIALTGVAAFLAPLGTLKKWVLFFCAIPIAVAVNVLRLTVTAAMAHYIGPDAAHGFLHGISGMIMFAGALVLAYLVFILEFSIEKRQRQRKTL